jgi:RNA polymerase sigma-70 factor (ECF subfamily)
MYANASDGELIAQALRQDRGAFAALFDRHAGAVFDYAWGLTRDRHDAEDLTQDVFATAWGKLRGIRVIDSSALPWLLVTTRNHSLNHARRAFFRTTVQLNETLATVDETNAVDRREELQWVMQEIGKLSGADQRLCQLCLVEGYGYAEAAAHLGLTTSGVAKRIERVRARLRAAVRGES